MTLANAAVLQNSHVSLLNTVNELTGYTNSLILILFALTKYLSI